MVRHGRLSPAREAAGIRTSARGYPQAALVLNFGHRSDHAFTSTEFHTETGPFTQVPLAGQRSSLVWVVQPQMADELMKLDDETLPPEVPPLTPSEVAVDPSGRVAK